jgi:sugar lactone lactonase YvrE
VLGAASILGESPIWSEDESRLLWVDIDRGELHSFDPAARIDEFMQLPWPVGVVVPRSRGGWAVAAGSLFGLIDEWQGPVQVVAEVTGDTASVRMNDGKCDAAGRFWAGTMGLSAEAHAGALYRLDPDLRVHKMLEGVTISNGIDWSPDYRLMYYVDSATRRVDVCDYEIANGRIRNRRRFVSFPDEECEPDGLTVDARGHVWVAIWNGSAVRRFAPDGRPAGQINLPVSQVTSCTFGGPMLSDLYVTTATQDLPPDRLAREPDAGGIFRIRDVSVGRPSGRFAA